MSEVTQWPATPWSTQPVEEATLFNPGFIATILASAARSHADTASHGMPWTLLFLVPAVVLYEDTRQVLPQTTNARFVNWITANPAAWTRIPQRARSLATVVREGARFGLRAGALEFDGASVASSVDVRRLRRSTEGEAGACVTSAAFVGRWWSKTADPSVIYALFGISP
jgi:hypothetical protein